MKNIYVSDLDGTLLNNSAQLSKYAEEKIKHIINNGVLFTVATARSVKAVQKMFENVDLTLPIIEFNGAFISDLKTGHHSVVNDISNESYLALTNDFLNKGLNYFVSSYDGKQDNLYYQSVFNKGEEWYINDRISCRDSRLKKTDDIRNVRGEKVVCLTLIDRYERLLPEFMQLQSQPDIEVHFQENQYSPGWWWLTVHSAKATKDQAIAELLKANNIQNHRVTAFGDNSNDIKMLQAADTAIAVANAKPEVLAVADQITASNLDDGVIKYILSAENI